MHTQSDRPKRVLSPQERLQRWLIIITTLLLVVAVVVPLTQLFSKAFQHQNGDFAGLANFRLYFSDPHVSASVGNTLFISFMTMLISVTLGFFYAYALHRTMLKGKLFFRYIALLPLFAPTLMHGISLLYLFGNQGLITQGFFGLIPGSLNVNIYGPLGIILAEIIYTFPQVVLILSVSLSAVDYRFYEAADSMGSSKIRQFFTITIPNIKYALLNSCFVSFILSFTDFGAPKVIGGNYNVLATDIYKEVVGQQDMTMGAVIGILLMVPVAAAFIGDRILLRKAQAGISAQAKPYRIKKNRARDIVFTLYCGIISLIMLLVVGAVFIAAFVNVWPYDMSLTLRHFSFRQGMGSYGSSIVLSLLTAVFGTGFTFFSAYLIEKGRHFAWVRQLGYFLSILPLALPGMVIGLSYIFFFNKPSFLGSIFSGGIPNPLGFMYGTMAIMVLANIIHFYAVPFITATTALKKLDKEFEPVSEVMGVPFYKTFFRVTVPMSLPAIADMAMYYFVNSMVTVSALIFLYTPHTRPASIVIVNMEDAGDIASAAALSVLIFTTNIIVRIIYDRIRYKQQARILQQPVDPA